MRSLSLILFAATVATSAHAAPIQWTAGSGGNDHWYDFVILDDAISATGAEAAAEASVFGGSNGYLATITSAAEQTFLNSIWTGAGSVSGQFENQSFFLIGASDRDSEGAFSWIGGPEDGDAVSYTNWSGGEPNDAGTGEDYTVAWWQDSLAGVWNDVPDAAGYKAYLVEYQDVVPAVPLPATLPMMLAALGGFLGLRKRVSFRS